MKLIRVMVIFVMLLATVRGATATEFLAGHMLSGAIPEQYRPYIEGQLNRYEGNETLMIKFLPWNGFMAGKQVCGERRGRTIWIFNASEMPYWYLELCLNHELHEPDLMKGDVHNLLPAA
jgi:hypothetical protein